MNYMRHIIFIVTLLLCSTSMLSQDKKYEGIHGLRDDAGAIFLEYRGISLIIKQVDICHLSVVNHWLFII